MQLAEIQSGKRRLGSTGVGRPSKKAFFAFLDGLKRPESLALAASRNQKWKAPFRLEKRSYQSKK
ncbi:hypothetical protein CSV69_02570 [Sporosarcina sp. P26b]|uniref:hypothetical protein n=1 Tax=Sporosarcina sp. P26b TaxID=2048253 RepID=UPI000A17DD98|nr:hypothetical protein [Sporosarcina sp. P26b]ARK22651.1 hypothetical protein SporoP32a_14560 [Sporosarcina ureae]PIC97107.1 hypothetical protein CSV69_02570 [Sporosarcina sp. P26b]